jgi:hypothetical protein
MKLARRTFVKGAAALAAVPLLPSFEPALAASDVLNKVPVLVPIWRTRRCLVAPPALVRLLCAHRLAMCDARPYAIVTVGPFRREIQTVDNRAAQDICGRAANALDAVGIDFTLDTDEWLDAGEDLFSGLCYVPRHQRHLSPGWLRVSTDKRRHSDAVSPLPQDELERLALLEQEVAELAGDAPPRCNQLR